MAAWEPVSSAVRTPVGSDERNEQELAFCRGYKEKTWYRADELLKFKICKEEQINKFQVFLFLD
jgi:hypothetical protein